MTSLEISHYYPTHSTLCIEVVTCHDCGSVHRIPAPQLMLRLAHKWAKHMTILRPRSLIAEHIDIPPGLLQETIEIHSSSSHCQLCFIPDFLQLSLFPKPTRSAFVPQPFGQSGSDKVPKAKEKHTIIPATLDEL